MFINWGHIFPKFSKIKSNKIQVHKSNIISFPTTPPSLSSPTSISIKPPRRGKAAKFGDSLLSSNRWQCSHYRKKKGLDKSWQILQREEGWETRKGLRWKWGGNVNPEQWRLEHGVQPSSKSSQGQRELGPSGRTFLGWTWERVLSDFDFPWKLFPGWLDYNVKMWVHFISWFFNLSITNDPLCNGLSVVILFHML